MILSTKEEAAMLAEARHARPWLERREFGYQYLARGTHWLIRRCYEAGVQEDSPRGKLIAAAPALLRALLDAEWSGPARTRCPCCQDEDEHVDGCAMDAALTAAGLPNQPIRDRARAEIAKMKPCPPTT